MNLITQSKFKDLVKTSKQAVNQLVKKETVTVVIENGVRKIDLDGHDTQLYLADKKIKLKESETDLNLDDITEGKRGNQGGFNEKRSYEIEKIKQQTEQFRIKNEQIRGNLIEKRLVEILFGKIYQIDEDQFKQAGVDISKRSLAIFNSRNKQKAKDLIQMIQEKDDIKLKNIESILNSDLEPMKIDLISMFEDIATGVLNSVRREIDMFLAGMEEKKSK